MRTTLFLVIIAFSAVVSAQEASYEKVLLPIAPGRVLGAVGSDWRTYAVISNTGTLPAEIRGALNECGVLCPTPPPLPAQASFAAYEMSGNCYGRGGFLSVDSTRVRDIAISLRTRDYSRSLESWGTAVPVVYSRDLYAGSIGITDIPVEPQFRTTLRVLDADSTSTSPLQVRIYGIVLPQSQQLATADKLLTEMTLLPLPPPSGDTTSCPGFAELSLPRFEFGNPYTALRVQITAPGAEREYWAYVSVVDNVTQHFTILAPTAP